MTKYKETTASLWEPNPENGNACGMAVAVIGGRSAPTPWQPNLRADKINDQKITAIIRRSIAGDYNHYADAWHPALKAVEIDLACAGSSFPQRVAGEFLAPTLSTRPAWVKAVLEAAGEWVLVIDDGMQSSSADALWLIQAVERPSYFLSLLENQGVATDALMMKRQVKGLWLVAIQSSVLKDIIKKSQKTNY